MHSAKTLSAEDDSFIIAMAISEGDEDYTTWTWFLEKLKIACPTLETGNLESNHNEFVFVL